MSNVMIGAVSSFKPGDKVVIAKKNAHTTARTGKILISIYPDKQLVKTSKGMFYMDPKYLTKKATRIGAVKPYGTAELAKTGRFAGRPTYNFRVIWTDPYDKSKNKEYHRTLESAKESVADWIELGYPAKYDKGDYTATYWGDVRNQI